MNPQEDLARGRETRSPPALPPCQDLYPEFQCFPFFLDAPDPHRSLAGKRSGIRRGERPPRATTSPSPPALFLIRPESQGVERKPALGGTSFGINLPVARTDKRVVLEILSLTRSSVLASKKYEGGGRDGGFYTGPIRRLLRTRGRTPSRIQMRARGARRLHFPARGCGARPKAQAPPRSRVPCPPLARVRRAEGSEGRRWRSWNLGSPVEKSAREGVCTLPGRPPSSRSLRGAC